MNALVLTPINGEPRIQDLLLAENLGFAEPRMIRKLIKRHEASLSKFGHRATVERCIEVGNGVKRMVDEFYLNKPQALFICMKSETDDAFRVQEDIINVYTAYLNGDLRPQPQSIDRLLEERMTAIASKLIADLEARLQPQPPTIVAPTKKPKALPIHTANSLAAIRDYLQDKTVTTTTEVQTHALPTRSTIAIGKLLPQLNWHVVVHSIDGHTTRTWHRTLN